MLDNTLGLDLRGGLFGGLEEGLRVSYALEDSLEICLEGRDRARNQNQFELQISAKVALRRSHLLAVEYKLSKLSSNTRVVDSRWDAS